MKDSSGMENKAYYHLPGLFEFYEFYKVFLPLFNEKREYFYDWCDIGSIYGAPADILWGGGRIELNDTDMGQVFRLMNYNKISARLALSNSLIRKEHLKDDKASRLCRMFHHGSVKNGIIIHSELLLDYLRENYPDYYFVSSTTKVLTDFNGLKKELDRKEFSFVVPDFRLNKEFDSLSKLSKKDKDKIEFLCNECCSFECANRKACYESVSKKILGEESSDWVCVSRNAAEGYKFSKAMENKAFISVSDIKDKYIPMGFSNFKIEGRSLGSAILLEFIIYYMTKPEYALKLREEMYLDSMLDLF